MDGQPVAVLDSPAFQAEGAPMAKGPFIALAPQPIVNHLVDDDFVEGVCVEIEAGRDDNCCPGLLGADLPRNEGVVLHRELGHAERTAEEFMVEELEPVFDHFLCYFHRAQHLKDKYELKKSMPFDAKFCRLVPVVGLCYIFSSFS